MDLQRLYGLDRSSVQFPDQLDQFLHEEGHVESIQNLPDGELSEFLDYLNSVLEQLDHTGQPFRKGLQVLQKISGSRGTLSLFYEVSGALSSISGLPVAFGGSGDVYKGKVDTGADVCIKKIRRCYTDNVDEVTQSFCREAAVWKHLRHPNIVPFLGVTLDPLQLVSQWMPEGELRDHVTRNPEVDLINLLCGIAEGLAYLHSCNVIHADLKGPNVMVDGSGNPRITDFGLATIARSPYSPGSTSDEDGYTARWCAPELLAGGQSACKESDIFSFGMIIIEVFTGRAPFSEWGTLAVVANLIDGKIPNRPNHPSFTDDLWDLTVRCLKKAPSDRPNAEQVLATLKKIDEKHKNKIPSPFCLPLRPPFIRQRRNAGAKPLGIVLGEKYHVREKSDDKNLYNPPHPYQLSNNTEEVPLIFHESYSSEKDPLPIQPQPTPKRHGFWCRIKSTRGVASVFSSAKRLESLTGLMCCCQ